ncbi:MAG TPA: DUF805 domain-containing protein [Caulobacteraceae bacterium]|jgi:uncharacterized membrane protein YhaH (DUF805 family)|nr:DUF805 domain-containing protein [Caulobacteraceae bacterium]
MGAISELFGFEGRIGRVGYLCRSIAVVALVLALALEGSAALMRLVRPMGLGDYESANHALTIGVALLALWSSLALASRRLRDMGLEPAHILPLFVALWVVNTVLLEPLSRLRPDSFGVLETSWAALQAAAMLPLLFWPGRSSARIAPAGYEPSGPTAYLDWRGSD